MCINTMFECNMCQSTLLETMQHFNCTKNIELYDGDDCDKHFATFTMDAC